jgi:quinohemoprotein ethanol dehydrogenase
VNTGLSKGAAAVRKPVIKRACGIFAAAASLLLLAGCNLTGVGGNAVADASGASADPDNWPSFGRTPGEQHFSPLDEINLDTVGDLTLAWHYDLPPTYTAAPPVTGDGKMFMTTGHSFITALDPETGKMLWEYDAKTRERAKTPLHMGWGNKGIAYWNNRVFLATTDGFVIALDADTGQEVWKVRQFEENEIRNAGGAPRVFDGKVIIGHGGADISPIRGYVTAYDAMSGKQLWRFYTVPSDPSKPAENKADAIMRATWKGDWYGKGGGGTMWNAFSYDPELNLIYLGVGNGFPYAQDLRSPGGGDNLFLASIVAVNADTGEYVWHYQVCPAEQWDCTAVQDMSLADLEIDGKPRKVLLQAPKNGFLYVIDRTNGQYISAEKIDKVTWAERIDANGRPVENPGIRYRGKQGLFEMWPGPQGAHNWLPQAYSPRTKLVYIPVIRDGALIGDVGPDAMPMMKNMGVTLVPDADLPGNLKGFLKAWNPVTQKPAWVVEVPGAWPGGVLATGGDLVFQGQIDHRFVARDARTGKEVWSFKAQAPIVSPPISYRVNGRQYVTVITGNHGSGAGIQSKMVERYDTDYRLPRHVLTFAIGGKDKLPAFAAPARVTPQDPGFVPVAATATAGGTMFGGTGCMVCHGMNAVAGGAAPDLRFSPVIVDAATFRAVVKDGALKLNGMPNYPQLGDAELEAIRHYLRARAMETGASMINAALPAQRNRVIAPAPPAGGQRNQAVPGGM